MAESASGWNEGGASRDNTADTYTSRGTTATTRIPPLRAEIRILPGRRFPASDKPPGDQTSIGESSIFLPPHAILSPAAESLTLPSPSASRLPAGFQTRIESPASRSGEWVPSILTRTGRTPAASGRGAVGGAGRGGPGTGGAGGMPGGEGANGGSPRREGPGAAQAARKIAPAVNTRRSAAAPAPLFPPTVMDIKRRLMPRPPPSPGSRPFPSAPWRSLPFR